MLFERKKKMLGKHHCINELSVSRFPFLLFFLSLFLFCIYSRVYRFMTLYYYSNFKIVFGLEPYITAIDIDNYRNVLLTLKVQITDLRLKMAGIKIFLGN